MLFRMSPLLCSAVRLCGRICRGQQQACSHLNEKSQRELTKYIQDFFLSYRSQHEILYLNDTYASHIKQCQFQPQKVFTFTFMHLADAFIQSDLQYIQAIHLYCQYVCMFPGNRTHNLCAANAML